MGRAGACRSVCARWGSARQSARKKAELVKWAGAPTRRQMHRVGRGPPRRGSMSGGYRVPWRLPISQAPPFFEHFAAQTPSKHTRTCRHQPAPWQPRLDPRRALRALALGCLRRFRGVASFQSLLRTNIFRKQFSHSCCWSRRFPTCIFKVAVRTMEANVMRLCRRLRPTARFSCLLRLRSLENEEFTSKTALSQLLLLTQGSQENVHTYR